jgi:RNA polymerase sigma-70 factor (ECF subfamily)
MKHEKSGNTSSADPRSFGKLVVDHQSRVRNYIRSLGVASSSVDDLAQEAFVVAYKRFDTYEQGTSFPAWVCTIARYLVWGDRRKESRRRRILDETITNLLVSNDPYQDLANEEQSSWEISALQTCMDTIPEEHREMVIQRYEKGIEAHDIAERMGIKAGTLRQRLLRLRLALQECMTNALERRFT